jgi:hypothetical protein
LVLVPLAFLDAAVSLYQAVCFRLWRLPRARRRDCFRIDRHKLAYLSPLQKLNCVYCGYANRSETSDTGTTCGGSVRCWRRRSFANADEIAGCDP